MPLDSVEGALKHHLADLLSAETQFAKALQQTIKAAESEDVRQMAEQHHEETLGQIENLKQAFKVLGARQEKVVCAGAQGIVAESNTTLKEEKPKGVFKDLALVAGNLSAEHYEIAGYTAAIGLAKGLGNKDVQNLLQANLKQEKETAKKLEAAATKLVQEAKSQGAVASADGANDGGSKSGAKKAAGSKSKS